MKRFLWTMPMLFVVLSASAFASSVTIGLSPNNGSGDNFAFLQGLDVGISGGTAFEYFNTQGYAPGSTLGGTTDVFFSSGFVQIGGTTYDLLFTGPGTLFVSSFTLPANGGKNFAIQAFASFSAQAQIFVNGQPQLIGLGGGAPGLMTFTWDPSSGLFFANPVVFTTAPEPGTLGLMGTGLISMLGLARRKTRANLRRAWNKA
jgi:PEP-CTERM motif